MFEVHLQRCSLSLKSVISVVDFVQSSKIFSLRRFTCLALAAGAVGCAEKPPEPVKETPSEIQANSAEENRRRLGSAIQRIEPATFARQSRREMVVNGLNSWLAIAAESEVEKLKISDKNAAMLSPATLRTAGAVRFTENDVVYVRDCLVMKSLTESIWQAADAANSENRASDRERVVYLFRHLIRNISLMGADENRVPVGLYETLLTGRGTVEDRVWAFAEALRQRSLDVVVLKASTPGDPSSADITAAADLLVGVVVADQLLLFDPLRGTGVPKAGDVSPIVTDPAGLEAISGIDRWKSATASVVCHPSAFAPRMLVLQERLEAADAAVLYEELVGGTSEIKPLVERLGDVIGSVWASTSLKVWEVPEQRIAAAASLTEEQKQAFTVLMRPLDGPFERESVSVGNLLTDPNVNEDELTMDQKMELKMAALEKLLDRSDDLFGKPSRRLLMTRVDQIMGANDVGMIQDLQQIRIASLQEKVELEIPIDAKQAMVMPFPLPKAILDVQRSAVGDTLYWTSMTQMSRNDMGAAVATLRNYRRQYPTEKQFYPTLVNEAEALLSLGDNANAIVALKEADVDMNPQRPQVQWLLNRVAATSTETPAASTPPADSPASAEPAVPEAAAPEAATPEAAAPVEPAELKSDAEPGATADAPDAPK